MYVDVSIGYLKEFEDILAELKLLYHSMKLDVTCVPLILLHAVSKPMSSRKPTIADIAGGGFRTSQLNNRWDQIRKDVGHLNNLQRPTEEVEFVRKFDSQEHYAVRDTVRVRRGDRVRGKSRPDNPGTASSSGTINDRNIGDNVLSKRLCITVNGKKVIIEDPWNTCEEMKKEDLTKLNRYYCFDETKKKNLATCVSQ